MAIIQPGFGMPPAIALVLNEKFSLADRMGARKKLRGMVKEIKFQAQNHSGHETVWPLSSSVSSQKYEVVMDGGLNLFSDGLACGDLACRFKSAEQVARSIALMADTVWMHDGLTQRFLKIGRTTNAIIDELLNDVYVLHKLRPLIELGLMKFYSAGFNGCGNCLENFEEKLTSVVQGLLEKFSHDALRGVCDIRKVLPLLAQGYLFDNKQLYLEEAEKFSDEEIKDSLLSVIGGRVYESFSAARSASAVHGTVFSNSKFGLAGLLEAEGKFGGLNNLSAMEAHRAASLPWISGLSIEQTIDLRDEASLALPRLREFLSRRLGNFSSDNDQQRGNERDYIAELREQAAEVGSELKLATQRRPMLRRAAQGMMALGIVVYGFSESPAIGLDKLALVMSMIALLHDVYGHEAPDVDNIKAKPGYVLVAAQNILAHADK